MDPPRYEQSQKLIMPTIETPEIVYTVLIVGDGAMVNHLIYRYSDFNDDVPDEDRRVFTKTYRAYTVTRMVRATSYGNIFIDFIVPYGMIPSKIYFQPVDEVIWLIGSNMQIFPYNYNNRLSFTDEKYTKEEITLRSLLSRDPLNPATKVEVTKKIIVPKFRVSSQNVIISDILGGTVDNPTIIDGPLLYKPYSAATPETNVIPFTHVNFETGQGIEDFFKTLLISLTGKPDLYFGEPLSQEELTIIEKARELRKRGIFI